MLAASIRRYGVLHPDIRTELGRDRVVTIAREAGASSKTSIVVTPRRLPGLRTVSRPWTWTARHGTAAVQLRHRETT
jgi:hypothetical protein